MPMLALRRLCFIAITAVLLVGCAANGTSRSLELSQSAATQFTAGGLPVAAGLDGLKAGSIAGPALKL